MEDCSHFNKTPVSYIRSLRSRLPGKKAIRPRQEQGTVLVAGIQQGPCYRASGQVTPLLAPPSDATVPRAYTKRCCEYLNQ